MIKVRENKDLTSLNTFGVRASCARFIEYDYPEELSRIEWDSLPRPLLHIGSGSNLLFTAPFEGTVLKSSVGGIKVVEEESVGDSVLVRAGASVLFDDLCAWAARKNIWGVENLSGIPGTVGASAVQNIGAYGVEAADVIETVECFRIADRSFIRLTNKECEFAYRDSFFKHHRGEYVVIAVLFRLTAEFSPQLSYGHLQEEVQRNADLAQASADPYRPLYSYDPSNVLPLNPALVRDTVKIMRDAKLPNPDRIGSAGSFFKNPVVEQSVFDSALDLVKKAKGDDAQMPHYDLPDGKVKIPAAFLIEFCGFKGLRHGNAGVWDKQALVLVNATGKATAGEILELEQMIVEKVEQTFGIKLEAEVDHI